MPIVLSSEQERGVVLIIETSGSQPVASLMPPAPRGHVAMSGDISGCHNRGECYWHPADRGQGCRACDKELSNPKCQHYLCDDETLRISAVR